MSISAGNIDFSKLFETQQTGNNGAAGNGVPQVPAQESRGAEMDKFMKDIDFSKFNLQ